MCFPAFFNFLSHLKRYAVANLPQVPLVDVRRYRVELCYASDSVLLSNPSTTLRCRLVSTTDSACTSLLDEQNGICRHFVSPEPETSG